MSVQMPAVFLRQWTQLHEAYGRRFPDATPMPATPTGVGNAAVNEYRRWLAAYTRKQYSLIKESTEPVGPVTYDDHTPRQSQAPSVLYALHEQKRKEPRHGRPNPTR